MPEILQGIKQIEISVLMQLTSLFSYNMINIMKVCMKLAIIFPESGFPSLVVSQVLRKGIGYKSFF